MMKQIMKRAWQIYRTLTGDKIAKLSMALRQAWAEAKAQTTRTNSYAETKANKIKAELIERTDLFKKQETRDKAVKLINEAAYPAEWWIDNEDTLLCCKLADAMRCVQHGSVELKPYRDFSVPNAHN